MPKNTVAILSLSCGVSFTAYVALMITAMFFAGLQTGFARESRDAEARIAALETEYYDAISRISDSNLAALGLASPSRTAYVSADGRPTFTRADR